jgi:hypothetical protein
MKIFEAAENIAEKIKTDTDVILALFPGFQTKKGSRASFQCLIDGLNCFNGNLWTALDTELCMNKNCPGFVTNAIFGNKMFVKTICKSADICLATNSEPNSDSSGTSLAIQNPGKKLAQNQDQNMFFSNRVCISATDEENSDDY